MSSNVITLEQVQLDGPPSSGRRRRTHIRERLLIMNALAGREAPAWAITTMVERFCRAEVSWSYAQADKHRSNTWLLKVALLFPDEETLADRIVDQALFDLEFDMLERVVEAA